MNYTVLVSLKMVQQCRGTTQLYCASRYIDHYSTVVTTLLMRNMQYVTRNKYLVFSASIIISLQNYKPITT